MRPGSVSGQPRPSSVYDAGSPMRAGYRTAVNLGTVSAGESAEFLPNSGPSNRDVAVALHDELVGRMEDAQ